MADEPPKKEEKPELANPSNSSAGWDPFAQDRPGAGLQTASPALGSQGGSQQQPQLFDLVFSSDAPKKEEKEPANPAANPNLASMGNSANLQEVFGNPKQKEAEERLKKMSLLE